MAKEKKKSGFLCMVIFLCVLFSLAILYSIISGFNLVHNEKVIFCEVANSNADVVNELLPYFERYLDDSIESVKGINSSLANLLELQLVGSRDIEMPRYDCPKERCGILTMNLESKAICNLLEELKSSRSAKEKKE